MSLGYSAMMGSDSEMLFAQIAGENAASAKAEREALEQRLFLESLPQFEAEQEAAGFSGWCAEMHADYGADGVRRAYFPALAAALSYGSAPALSAELMARQFARWELVEAAQKLGMAAEAAALTMPCPDGGFAARAWRQAAARVEAAQAAEQASAAEAAAAAEKAAQAAKEADQIRQMNNPFAALAALKK